MSRRDAARSALSVAAWAAAITAGIAATGAASVVISGWLIRGVEAANDSRRTAQERSALRDYFGGVSAAFSGLALLLLIVTLLIQQRELRLQRQELSLQRAELAASRTALHRAAEADLRTLHIQLTQMAMEDPALADVWNDYRGEAEVTKRQNLFSNLTFQHFVLMHTWGGYSDAELLVHARSMLAGAAFRRYWDAARAVKSDLPPESAEGRVFRVFEAALEEERRRTPPPAA
ncbi:DUF6082 family protein [Streptomyces sp. NPDC005863]|uniref:DUF6082 family protein n=1 Tax=unclassified Streptomyces TaxID=2593676 RepID=UPI0033D2D4AA